MLQDSPQKKTTCDHSPGLLNMVPGLTQLRKSMPSAYHQIPSKIYALQSQGPGVKRLFINACDVRDFI